MQTLSLILNMGFPNPYSGSLYRTGKSGYSWHYLVSSLWNIFLWNSGLWGMEKICESTCNHDFPCNGKEPFSRIIVYVQQNSLISLILEQILIPSAQQTSSNSPANFVVLSTRVVLVRLVFVIKFKNARSVSSEPFVFIPFAPTVLSNKSWRTSKYFIRLLSFAGLPTYARSKHQISFLNLANAFILLNLRVVRVNFVNSGFECKNCLNSDAGGLLAFIEPCTDRKAAPRCL